MPAEGRQVILQTKRWLPDRRLIVVAGASFAAIDLIAALRRHVCLVTRLRIDARLFAPAPPRGTNGPTTSERTALASVQGSVG